MQQVQGLRYNGEVQGMSDERDAGRRDLSRTIEKEAFLENSELGYCPEEPTKTENRAPVRRLLSGVRST